MVERFCPVCEKGANSPIRNWLSVLVPSKWNQLISNNLIGLSLPVKRICVLSNLVRGKFKLYYFTDLFK